MLNQIITRFQNAACFLLMICLPIAALAGTSAGMQKSGERAHTVHSSSEQNQPEALSDHHHNAAPSHSQPSAARAVGIDEKLGRKIPLDLTFKDEEDQPLSLAGHIQKPTLILPVFFTCPQTCSLMLANLAQAITQVPLTPGLEYQVLAFSFDHEDTPSSARFSKSNYVKLLSSDFPKKEWKFLTGDLDSITSFTRGAGYRFQRTGKHAFIHPNVLIVVAPDGTIIRYLYGPAFLPFDIGMALAEAEKGTPQISVRKILTYCFQYDAESRTYVLKTFRFFAAGVIVLLVLFLVFLFRKGKQRT